MSDDLAARFDWDDLTDPAPEYSPRCDFWSCLAVLLIALPIIAIASAAWPN